MTEEGFRVNDFDHLEKAQRDDATYGIYDTQGNCWIGDLTGPRLFTPEEAKEKFRGMPQRIAAQIAAQMAEKQLGYAMGRLRAREFNEQSLTLKDEIPTKMTPLEALVRIENGD